MRTTLTVLLLLAACLAACTAPPHTTIDYGADGVHFSTTVDRSLEGLQINKAADGTIVVRLDKSQSSASAVVAANVELEKVRMDGMSSLGGKIAEGVASGLKPKVVP